MAAITNRRLTFRFLFHPETIGAIALLHRLGDHFLKHLIAGYVVSCVGDAGPFHYKRSRRADSVADRAAVYVLNRLEGSPSEILDFFPHGSDERQYCSPGFNLPVGLIGRSIYTTYPEYHTSLDNRDFISFDAMAESVDVYTEVCRLLDRNVTYRNQIAKGEPHLSKYDLQGTVGAQRSPKERVNAIKWLLNLADGEHDLLAIAERSGLDFWLLDDAAEVCLEAGLVKVVERDSTGQGDP
jgi:aminopeptidase-like protein